MPATLVAVASMIAAILIFMDWLPVWMAARTQPQNLATTFGTA
jgi:hypothetical protein